MLASLCAPCARAAVWANIEDVQAQVLTNGVQITVRADGILEYDNLGVESYSDRYRPRSELNLLFPEAKNITGKTVIKVDQPPVSYIELSIPQSAEQGIGVLMRVVLFYSTIVRVRSSDDGLGVIVTVESNTSLNRGGGAESVEIQSGTFQEVEYDADTELIDVLAVKANVHALLADIGRKTGANVLVDDLIDPGAADGGGGAQITMTLTGATLEQAMLAIAAAAGLGMATPDETGGVYMFSAGLPSDLSAYRLAPTRSFSIENIEAQEAQGLLPNFLYPHLHVNHDQNAIVVSAPNVMLDKIGQDLGKVDRPSPQIMIEAHAVEFLTRGDLERSLGLSYEGMDFLASTDSATGEMRYETLVRLPESFEANLTALETEGSARVWAKPRMALMNGREARLFIGQTRFVEVEIPSYGGTTKQVQGVDVGVSLDVEAWTGGNGEITVELHPSDSNISEIDPDSGLPQISSREANTTVRVTDGETIVIGGLVRHDEFVTRRKIPILGEIPVIGELFRSKGRSTLDSELVIFVTPRLLDPVTGRPLSGQADEGMRLFEQDGIEARRAAQSGEATENAERADRPGRPPVTRRLWER